MELYEYEREHRDLLRRLAPECMVLLKSDGTFPLEAPCKVALYGSGARETIKGGTGSGDVNVRHYTTVEEGLENAGFTVTTKPWLESYSALRQQAHVGFVAGIKAKAKELGVPALLLGMGAVMPEPEYDLPLDGEGELCVYVLGRISGEGSDRHPAPGDFQLTQTEIRDILACREKYGKLLLVLNVGGVVDLSPVAPGGEYPAAVPDGHGPGRRLGGRGAGQCLSLRQAGLYLGQVGGLLPGGRLRPARRHPLHRGCLRGLPLF